MLGTPKKCGNISIVMKKFKVERYIAKCNSPSRVPPSEDDSGFQSFFAMLARDGVPIAGVADIVDQSAVAPLKQVGASRDLSEATRRRAVRALWGTVTHTPVKDWIPPDCIEAVFSYRSFGEDTFVDLTWDRSQRKTAKQSWLDSIPPVSTEESREVATWQPVQVSIPPDSIKSSGDIFSVVWIKKSSTTFSIDNDHG
ncbi:hypothetical protein HZH66_002515 [Vespula vulgaris]|uniref:Uncharacterized protein n=1 Tax=Vespula vulgaris TaxID=7454 RepID=A0A834KK00_VESVU|nr:hypothetical protein HZH66_002515 [Vespula vulgaris]